MIHYGARPQRDELEVTLFGPGYGEAIAIHLGEDHWLLIDSCIDPNVNAPASEAYLSQIGVSANQVKAIVASHWHDDHVRGISQLAARYPSADFIISAVFNNRQAAAFLAAYSGSSSSGLARGTRELFQVVDSRNTWFPALHRSNILETTLNMHEVRVTALSPLPAAYSQFIANFAQFAAGKDQPINNAPEVDPNMSAVVIHIDFGDDAILLGADLMESQTHGWTAVVNDQWSGARRPASAYKVAHHGSHTGNSPRVWSRLLTAQPVACLTPFTHGNVRLPTAEDKQRLRADTANVYISSASSRRPDIDSRHLKRLGDICKKIAQVDNGFGAVRIRKRLAAPSWNVELFGTAQAL